MYVADQSGTLTPAQRQELESTPSAFRMKVVFESRSDATILRQDAKACVDSPSTICLVVDAGHKRTATEFGVDTGIRSSDYPQVARAGNPDFHEGHWVDGVKAVSARASVMSQKTSAPAAVVLQQPVIEKPVPIWPFLLGFGAIVMGCVLIWRRNRKKFEKTIEEFKEEAAEMRSNNIKERSWVERLDRDPAPRPEPETFAQLGSQVFNNPSPATPPPIPAQARPATLPPARNPDAARSEAIRRNFDQTYGYYQEQTKKQAPPRLIAPREAHHHHRHTPTQQVVVVDNGPSFTEGMLIGEALGRTERAPERRYEEPVRERSHTPMPAPSFSGGGDDSSSNSSDSGGDSSSTDTFSGGGDDSSF
jgi:uncharacterized membrane protein YgcG